MNNQIRHDMANVSHCFEGALCFWEFSKF